MAAGRAVVADLAGRNLCELRDSRDILRRVGSVSACRWRRAGDEWHCSCGRQWATTEPNPHPAARVLPVRRQSLGCLAARRKALADIRAKLGA